MNASLKTVGSLTTGLTGKETAMLTGPNFADRLAEAVQRKKSVLCVGIDLQLVHLPLPMIQEFAWRYGRTFEAMSILFFAFGCKVLHFVHDQACCVKINMGFLERLGPAGGAAFQKLVAEAHKLNLLVVADVKRSDGKDSADAYADTYIGQVPFFAEEGADPSRFTSVQSPFAADGMTIDAYFGEACVAQYVDRVRKFGTGLFAVAKTSFKPDSRVEQLVTTSGNPVWLETAKLVGEWSSGTEGASGLRNVGVVLGATFPEDTPQMRQALPNSWFLRPGYGKQGGGADGAVTGMLPNGLGVIVNNSRGITGAFLGKDGKMICEPGKCFDLVRQASMASRDDLAAAARRAGTWPF